MADYSSLSTQITTAKNAINTVLSGSPSAQDLVFLSSALDKLGTMLGVNDVVAATNTGVTTVNNTTTSGVSTLNTTLSAAVDTINSTYLHPLFLIGV